MKPTYYIGLDIAKNVFQVFQADTEGRQISNRKLKRSVVLTFFANLPSSVVGIEACASAHYWARMIKELGHDVRLIQPIRVKAFLGNRNKTDAADAKAICEALMHPGTRFVPYKTETQQDMDHMLAMRERLVQNRTQIINQTRAFLSERGIVTACGRERFEKDMQGIIALHWDEWSSDFQMVLTENYGGLQDINQKLAELDNKLSKRAKEQEDCRRLMSISGIGCLTALALISHIGDVSNFHNGRQLAAYFGLTPREYSSGGKQRLLGITKHGNQRIRTLLILASHAAIMGLERRKRDENGLPRNLTGLDKWILALKERIGGFKATVALANKMARMCWALLSKNEIFNPAKAVTMAS